MNNSLEGTKLSEYIIAIDKIVGAKIIMFARMSKNRIRIYLSVVQIVDQLIENHPTLEEPFRQFAVELCIIISNMCSTTHNFAFPPTSAI